MKFLADLGIVAIVAGMFATLVLLCSWWAEPQTRRVAVIASSVASALVVGLLRRHARSSSAKNGP